MARKYGATAEESDITNLEGKNPEDRDRFITDLDAQYQRRGSTQQTGDGARPAQPALADAYRGYLGQPTAPAVDLSPVTNLIQQMIQQTAQDRQRQDQERAAMRQLLTGRMAEAAKPVDMNAPGIREVLSAQRLGRQRSAERQRSQAATRLSVEGLGDSGAAETTYQGIEQARGEGESADTADVLGREHQAKRNELMQLYQMALSSGDAESARTLQQQLSALDATISTSQMQEGARRFDNDLGFRQSSFDQDLGLRRSSFMDNLGLQIMLAQLGANRDAAGAFL